MSLECTFRNPTVLFDSVYAKLLVQNSQFGKEQLVELTFISCKCPNRNRLLSVYGISNNSFTQRILWVVTLSGTTVHNYVLPTLKANSIFIFWL